MHRVSYVRHREVRPAVSLVPVPSPTEGESAIAKLIKCKSPCSDQSLGEITVLDVKHYGLRMLGTFRHTWLALFII